MSKNKCVLSLPEKKLPDCWSDEARMNVLYAPFRNRSVNPQDWDSKLFFWRNFILECCVYNKCYTFKTEDLQKLFNRNGRSPGCLNTIVEEMHKNGEIKPVAEFLQRPAQTWSRWAADVFIKKPIIWSYSKIKDSLLSPKTDNTYVHLQAVEKEAENLLTTIPQEFKNKVVSLQQLLKILNVEDNKIDSFKLLLHYLVCKDKADVREIKSESSNELSSHNLLIKFGDIKKNKSISDTDISMHILVQNEQVLTENLEKLESEVQTIINNAKAYLSKGHRQMAKNCLRRKHQIENIIIKRSNALQNVQTLLIRVRDADTDAEVLDTYKIALSTLRKSFKESGLTEDSVYDTMSDVGEILELHEDIQTTLSQSFSGNDEELEAELSELISGFDDNSPVPPKPPSPMKPVEDPEALELERRLKNLRLPDVPSTSPTTSKNKISL